MTSGVVIGPNETVPPNTVVTASRNHLTQYSAAAFNRYTHDERNREVRVCGGG